MRHLTKRQWLAVLVGSLVLAAVTVSLFLELAKRNRSVPDEPFRIAGNLYYVGHAGVTAFLITGPEGHVLIDGGYSEHGPLIIESIAKLGFDIDDVEVLLNSHAHSDHAGGLRDLQEASGAQLWVSEGDSEVMSAGGADDPARPAPLRVLARLGGLRFDAPRIDRRFKDGETVRVGPIELTAHVTAGHTRGCTSWSFPVQAEERELLAVNICSLSLFPFVSLVEPEAYPGIRADFERSFRTLRALPADIFLASHSRWFDLNRKRRALAEAEQLANPFIDQDGYLAFIDQAERQFRERLSDQQRSQ